ncbi:MAG: hypothetical protein N2258_08925 [Brevinematales bacterium]|nr:hypothetical protein [Brevinematales bacterium]
MKKIGKVLSSKSMRYILTVLIIILIIFIFFLLKPKAKKVEKTTEEVKKVEITKEYFGKITKSNSGYIIKDKVKEKSKTGSYLQNDSLIVAENEPIEISNKNSHIVVEPESKIYISEKGVISVKNGGIKIKGDIKLVASKYFVYGKGELSVKVKDDELQLSSRSGEAVIVVSKEKKVTLKAGEGTIITPEGIEEPFKLPETGDIKVRVY